MSTVPSALTNVGLIRLAWQITGGWGGMLKGKDFWLAVVITAMSFGTWVAGDEWCKTVISVTPSLLGFTLSGFAIFLGFGRDDFKQLISRVDELKSPYMGTSSAFMIFVVVQLISLLYAMCAGTLYVPTPKWLLPYKDWVALASAFGGCVGYLLFIYGLLLSLRAGLRIFRMSRWLHIHLLLAQPKCAVEPPPNSNGR
jgi:hypothetical protein